MDTTADNTRGGEAVELATEEAERGTLHTYPFVPLKKTVIFPGAKVTLNIGREKSIKAITEARKADQRFVASAQRQAEVDAPGPEDVFDLGTLVEIKQYEVQTDNTVQVIVEGVTRARITVWPSLDPFLQVSCELVPEPVASGAQASAVMRHAQSLFDRFTQLSRRFNADDVAAVAQMNEAGLLADTLAIHVVTDDAQQQELLETLEPLQRLEKICVTLGNEIEILELENKIRQRVRQQVDKNQREYYLKEQLRAIQEELGHDQASEIVELRG